MKHSSSVSPYLVILTLLFVVASHSTDIRLSGTVTDLSGNVLSGARVALVGADKATSTNTSGAWSISETSTGNVTHPKSSKVLVTRHLVLDGNRIKPRFEGVDVVGRNFSGAARIDDASIKPEETVSAARSAASEYIDTLLYSWNGQVRARVGITSLVAGAVGPQSIDTSTGELGPDVISYGGQTYKTVTIGTQTWMAENLNYAVDSSWCYAKSADSCAKYGRLYQWSAMMGLDASYNSKFWGETLPRQGICPSGWHVPSDAEWTVLTNFIGGEAGRMLKASSDWYASGKGLDTYGFRALPAGHLLNGRFFDNIAMYTYFWSSSESGEDIVWSRTLTVGFDVKNSRHNKNRGFSVRCLKNGV